MASHVQTKFFLVPFCLAFICVINGSEREQDDLTIRINDGNVRGERMKSESGGDYIAYRGVPYAQPPVGPLRFKPPLPSKPWTGTRNATADAPPCPQMESSDLYTGTEDCLYLNVYTPMLPERKSGLFDVVVHIHGGGFHDGSGSSRVFDPRRFPLKDIVLVSLTYRVSALGFLSTNDSSSPGNYGLLDQLEGLRWVRKNIEYFGGDPESVTLLGQSAGGASVMYMLMSPLAQGLFHRVIALSGSPVIPYALQKDPWFWTEKLARDVGCPIVDSEELVNCLRNKSAQEIIENSGESVRNIMLYTFTPTVDNYYLTDTPMNLLRSGLYQKNISLMFGATKGEAYCWFSGKKDSENFTDDEILLYLRSIVDVRPNIAKSVQQIKERYFSNITSYENEVVQDIVRKALTEGKYRIPLAYTANLMMEKGVKPYYYQYDYEGPWFNKSLHPGVCHSDDLYLLFDGLYHVESFDEASERMKENYQKLITNFIKTGNPNGDESLISWPHSENGELLVFHLNNDFSVEHYDYANDDTYKFWTKVLNELNVMPSKYISDEL